MIDPGIKNKVALITGANHGIGAATAKAFATQGAKVFLTYYYDSCHYSEEELQNAREAGIGGDKLYRALQQQSAEPLVQAIRDQGGDAVAHEADLGDPNNIPNLFDLCEEELGSVDIVVNNHTYCVNETFDPALTSNEGSGTYLTSAAGISAHLTVNAQAYALIMSEYLNRYLKRKADWGRIINISTDAAHAHTANISYAASKHAIESYSRSAAAEMGKYGITVNIVAPGPTQTGYITPESEKNIVAMIPLQRLGEPEDIADVVMYFATEQARWVTGQLIYVGGGWRMHQ
ncbi:SDR family NAD(P)-dependent oxidoreductase [Candidatus Neomarinimicrobiota bacterium]